MINTLKTLTRNGTDNRVYGGDCDLIHVIDGKRKAMGLAVAYELDKFMRQNAENRTEEEKANQLLCPGCYMVVMFNALVSLAEMNGQPMTELGNTMANAFSKLAKDNGYKGLEEIRVMLDPE